MRCVLVTLLALAALALVGATAVVGLGLYNVSAAVGHFPGVSWILHTTYHNSVELRAPPSSAVPPLTDDMAAVGARHFDSACRFCHAAPEGSASAIARSMVPPPPPIREAVRKWQPRHLFWIVRNGVKMSGMPHWPSKLREDDVWLLVAFLDRVRDMAAEDYAALVAPPEDGDALVAYCAGCHGADGSGRGNAVVPRLDILGEAYIAASLRAFREGARQSGIMQYAASQLTDDEIAMLAHRFAAKPAIAVSMVPVRDDLIDIGRELALGAPASRDVPTCRACHGPWPTRRSELFPALAGQYADYLYAQLRLWNSGLRGGTNRAHIMHLVGQELQEEQMRALAAFYAAGAPAE